MNQPIMAAEQSALSPPQLETLLDRMAQMEAELGALKVAMQQLSQEIKEPVQTANGRTDHAASHPNPTEWTPPSPEELAYLQTLSEDELVPIHYMTDDDVRQALDEFEEEYGISSEEFYARWKQGDVEDIMEKISWSIFYENWLQILEARAQITEEAA